MANIITNHDVSKLNPSQTYWAYNCLDTCITFGVYNELAQLLDPISERIYAFERGMQNPAMTLQCRGMRVDEQAAWKAIRQTEQAVERCRMVLDRLAEVWWDKGLNPASVPQKQAFLYDVLKLPRQYSKDGKLTTGNEAITTLMKKAPWTTPILKCINRCQELNKQLSFLRAKRSPDGRIRASFNVGATETGRWSSSKNCFGDGLNYQNVFKKLRFMFVPDPGLKMGGADLEQAESRLVAYLANDPEYIAAHHAHDTHTYVARLIWPDLAWPAPDVKCTRCLGDDPDCNDCEGTGYEDVRVARQKNFIRHFSRRDLGKRFQHGSNYGGTEYVMSRLLQIPLKQAKDILSSYFQAFGSIRTWQEARKKELLKFGVLTSALGRRRQFYDRVWEGSTQREAIAFEPQSLVGDILNVALYRLWRDLDGDGFWILHQGHDSVVFQYDPEREEEILAKVRDLMKVEVTINGRVVSIPVSVKIGDNWLDVC